MCLISILLIIIDTYLTLKQSLYHIKSAKLAADEYSWPNYVKHFDKSVQIKVSMRVKLGGMKETFRKKDLGKKWNYLEGISKKEISGEVNLSHDRKNIEEMGPHHLLSPVWRWKHPTATMVWWLPDLGGEINSSHLKKGMEG